MRPSTEVTDWAEENENIRVVLLTSSRTNPNAPVDMLSDYDIELFVRDLQPFLESDQWLEIFGEILVRWPYEPVDNQDHTTRLVLYKDAPRIDFQIKKRDILKEIVSAPDLPEYYDYVYVTKRGKIVEEGTFDNLCNAQGEFSRLWDKYLAEDNKNQN